MNLEVFHFCEALCIATIGVKLLQECLFVGFFYGFWLHGQIPTKRQLESLYVLSTITAALLVGCLLGIWLRLLS